jgi:hypothetical protein
MSKVLAVPFFAPFKDQRGNPPAGLGVARAGAVVGGPDGGCRHDARLGRWMR